MTREEHKIHRKHRSILYGAIVILIALQIVSFVVFTGQISKLRIDIGNGLKENRENLTTYFLEKLNDYNRVYQTEFSNIDDALSLQKQDLSLLKSSQEDFSGIIETAVKGVVSVVTDKSAGTGFIIDEDGFLVTNYHVIDNTNSINVLMSSGKVLPAGIIGFDTSRDVALLKISQTGDYDFLELSDSDNLQVGKKVIAIGNPLGLSFSVTEGIISGVDRKGPNGLAEYIQTDVSLNPGNSGGPLIDTQGRVVGINNFKIGGGAEGLGFALESNSVRAVVNTISAQAINKTLIQ